MLLLLLLQDLRSEDPAEREKAESALVRQWPGSETRLREWCRDKDPEVALRAGRLLKILLARDELSPWVLEKVPGVDVHFAARDDDALGADFDRLLEGAKPPAAELKSHLLPLVPAALRSARGKREEGHRIFMLGQLGIRMGVPRMIELLSDLDEEKRLQGAEGLLFMPTSRAVPKLVELVVDDGPVSKAALRTLGQWRALEGIPAARRALKEPRDGDVRALAARLLARTRAEGAYDAILPLLDNEKGNGFVHGVSALGELGDERAVARLEEELKKAHESARGRIQYALDMIKGREVMDLDGLFEHEREAAAKAASSSPKAQAILCGAKLRQLGRPAVCEEHGDLAVLIWAEGDVDILPQAHRRVVRAKVLMK